MALMLEDVRFGVQCSDELSQKKELGLKSSTTFV